jgi:hypothetical protein
MIAYKNAALWRRLFRKVTSGIIMYDYTDPLNRRLPHKLEMGDCIDVVLKYGTEFRLDPRTTHIGLSDNFGRIHWAPRRDVQEFKTQYEEDFPGVLSLFMKELKEKRQRARTSKGTKQPQAG